MVAVGVINIKILKIKRNGQTQHDKANADRNEKYHSKARFRSPTGIVQANRTLLQTEKKKYK